MIRAVVFDMYETLITHYHGKSQLYFSPQMAEDAGVLLEKFQSVWRGKEQERTVGKLSLEDTLREILAHNTSCSEDEVKAKVAKIAKKRIATAECCFENLHPEIIPMLEELKERGIFIGLISNCFSEEAEVIRRSILAPYFDVMCLSYELGVCKPQQEIYRICADQLGMKAEECLYVGDGGSSELEAARQFGMRTAQAAWYLNDRDDWPLRKKDGFETLYSPADVLNMK